MLLRLSSLLRPFASNRMASSSIILASAIIIGNGISFVALPWLSRLYTPEAFGVFGFVVSWGTIASVIFTLRLESVVPITSSTAQAESLARRAMNRTWIMTIGLSLVVLFLWLYGTGFVRGMGAIEILLGVGTAFSGSYFAIGRSMHQRLDDYKIIASSSIIRSFAFVGLSVVLALGSFAGTPSGASLLFASMVAFLIPGVLLHMTLSGDMRRAMIPGSALTLPQADYSGKALGRVTSSFVLSQISFQFPLWVAMGFFGSAAAGWMVMGYRLVMFPSDIICGSVSLVIARRIADSMFHNPQNLGADKRLLAFFLLGNFVLFALLGLCVLFLAGHFLGPEWQSAAPVMALLATIGLSFTVQPTVIQILGLLNRDREALAVNVTHFMLLAVGAVAFWWASGSLFTGVVALAIVELAFSISLSVYVMWAIRNNFQNLVKS
jgi:O-antigen/teichoic acid export membrane protein